MPKRPHNVIPMEVVNKAYAADFTRSAPDREPFTCPGLMEELIGAANMLAARQNQWCSSGETRSSIQVTKAAQSSTLLFVRKTVDEEVEDADPSSLLRNFDEESACSVFFGHTTCYDVLPKSGKLLVFDNTLPIRRAMQALVDHSLEAAPVWSSRLQCFTHFLTQGLCLRLLAQVFPLNPSSGRTGDQDVELDDSGDVDMTKPETSDHAANMTYWEGKTLGRVLRTYFNWIYSEAPPSPTDALQIIEAPLIVTPQDNLHRVTRLITLGRIVESQPIPPRPKTPAACTKPESSPLVNDVFYTPQNSPNSQQPLPSCVDSLHTVKQTVPPPRHVLISDKLGSGNLLGFINADRMLAYLRVCMRNLPSPQILKMQISELSRIRWDERGWLQDDSGRVTPGSDGSGVAGKPLDPSIHTHSPSSSRFYLQPNMTIHEALHLMTTAWTCAGLVCLPVAAEMGRGFLGMLAKLDIMSTIFSTSPDVALAAQLGTVMSLRPRPPGCSNQAMCFTTDSLSTVLDRMFRQKASCLAVFEKPGAGSSWNGHGALGPAVGVITTSDILHAIVLECDTSCNDGEATHPFHTQQSDPGAQYCTANTSGLRSSNSSNSYFPGFSPANGPPPPISPFATCRHNRWVPQSPAASAAAAKGHRNSLPLPTLRMTSKRPVTLDATGELSTSPLGIQPQIYPSLGTNPITRLFHRQKRASESESTPMNGLEGPFATHQRPNTRSQAQKHLSPSKKPTEEDNVMFPMDFL